MPFKTSSGSSIGIYKRQVCRFPLSTLSKPTRPGSALIFENSASPSSLSSDESSFWQQGWRQMGAEMLEECRFELLVRGSMLIDPVAPPLDTLSFDTETIRMRVHGHH